MPKIIALGTHPRSISTAIERGMMGRGDLKILHEPFSYVYYAHEKRAPVPFMHQDHDHPRTYSQSKEFTKNRRLLTPWSGRPAMCSHVPGKGEKMVRYYGYYSNVS